MVSFIERVAIRMELVNVHVDIWASLVCQIGPFLYAFSSLAVVFWHQSHA